MKGRHWLLAFGSLVASVAAAEVALRLLGIPKPFEPPVFVGTAGRELGAVPDHACFWRLSPSNPIWGINELGLRGPMPAPAARRIVCVGDSCTFGTGVTYEETYGVRLGNLLQRRRPQLHLESVLCATPAWSSHQSRALFEQLAPQLEPEITVIYCGAWNDYQPAIEGRTDREIAARLGDERPALRVFDILARATASAEDEARVRVPLPDFEDNLRAIVAQARALDSRVLFVVPPVRPDTDQLFPIAKEYREAVRRLAAELAVPAADAAAEFASLRANTGAPWFSAAADRSPLFVDGAHPTPFGHSRIAQRILSTLEAEFEPTGILSPPTTGGGKPRAQVLRVEPERVPALQESTIRLTGAHLETVTRVWVGPHCARRLHAHSPSTLECTLPVTTRPGLHPIRLVALNGMTVSETRLEVQGPELRAKVVQVDASQRALEVQVRGLQAGRQVGFYVTPERLARPDRTLYGPFFLAGDQATRPDGLGEFPYVFPPVAAHGITDASGSWTGAIAWPAGLERVQVQAVGMLTKDGEADRSGLIGALSAAVTVTLPPR